PMKNSLFSAASLASLAAFGLAACADDNVAGDEETATYRQEETETDDIAEAEEDALARSTTAPDQPAGAVPNTGGVTPGAAATGLSIADIRIKSDAERAAESAFALADANRDGML